MCSVLILRQSGGLNSGKREGGLWQARERVWWAECAVCEEFFAKSNNGLLFAKNNKTPHPSLAMNTRYILLNRSIGNMKQYLTSVRLKYQHLFSN